MLFACALAWRLVGLPLGRCFLTGSDKGFTPCQGLISGIQGRLFQAPSGA